ncbi:hypothetical protein [Lunatibacter salilacus]|uniref:hypothetical protein n=1 Tax=Lunatibacter salilacus TaxID=2483804 RepID=UPI00131E5908|nr:hypothetical protein [Lunatibacter salilacus]
METEYRNSSRIVLTFPDKKSEIIPLESIVGSNARVDELHAENQHTNAETMGKILGLGFKLDNVVKYILIFRKEES